MLHTGTWVHSQQSRVPESLQIAHFGVKSVFSAATFVAAKCTLRDINRCFPLEPFWREKCTFAGFMSCCDPAKCTFGDTSLCSHCELHFFWLQVCVSRCDFCCCKVYVLGSSLCFQMQSISLQSVHFGIKSVFSAATFVAAKCTYWGEVCVFRCDFCRCKVYILGSSLCFQMRLLSLQSVHFGIKSVFSDATFVSAKCIFWGEVCVLRCDLVSAKCTFWGQVCVFRCDLCRYKVYILVSSLCFQMRPLSLQNVHFGIKFVFWDATFVAAKCTFWDQVCVLRCDLCHCKVYILGSSLCFENRPLSLQSAQFGVKSVFWNATFVATQCTFWDQVCVLRCDLCRCKVYILQVRGRRQATWAPRVRPVTCAQTPTPTATPPTPTTRCAGAIRAGWPREPCVVSFQTYVILILSLPKNMCCWCKFIEEENESETRRNDW